MVPRKQFCCVPGVRNCAGFRTPALTCEPHAHAAGVRKAPRHEIAGSEAAAVQRSLWGFGRGIELEKVAPKGGSRRLCVEARVCVQGGTSVVRGAGRDWRCDGGAFEQRDASVSAAGREPTRKTSVVVDRR